MYFAYSADDIEYTLGSVAKYGKEFSVDVDTPKRIAKVYKEMETWLKNNQGFMMSVPNAGFKWSVGYLAKDKMLMDEAITAGKEQKEREDARKRKMEEEKLKKEQAEHAAKVKAERGLFKQLPGLEDLYKFLKVRIFRMERSPWGMPKENFKTDEVSFENMEIGKYYVISRGTSYEGGRGEGMYSQSVIQKTSAEEGKVILKYGVYGPSQWATLNTDAKELKMVASGTEFTEWIKTNKSQLANLNKELVSWMKDNAETAPAEWDPNWGMN
jgi:hypothetical protein